MVGGGWTLLSNEPDEAAEGSLPFELGNWSVITGRRGASDDYCVEDVIVESAWIWDTVVDFRELLW